MTRRFSTLFTVSLGLILTASYGIAQEHWVSTWGASAQQARTFAPPPPAAQVNGQPAAPPRAAGPPSSFNNQTVRMIVRTSIGGRRVRVQFSNAYGTAMLALGSAHVALRDKDSAIVAGSDRALMFNGKASASIPPGAFLVSDPVDLDVPKLADLAITVFVPADSGTLTMHATGLHTTYITKTGDFTSAPSLTDTTMSQSWYWIAGVEVMAPPEAATIVTFGDSITDGATSTVDTNSSWPSFLAQRLQANPATANLAVVNHGISGNRLLRDGAGVNALARFDRDVLGQAGVKWMTILEGINDIGVGMRTPAEAVSTDDIIGAYRQMIERAHEHGIKVIGCTLTPYQGAAYYSDAGETVREAVNQWIRTSGAFDAVVDFDMVTRDPANPKQIRMDMNIRDHLHPNDAGYKAMAEAFDLAVFGARAGNGKSR